LTLTPNQHRSGQLHQQLTINNVSLPNRTSEVGLKDSKQVNGKSGKSGQQGRQIISRIELELDKIN